MIKEIIDCFTGRKLEDGVSFCEAQSGTLSHGLLQVFTSIFFLESISPQFTTNVTSKVAQQSDHFPTIREIHDKIPKKRKKLKPNEMKLILNWKLAGEAQVGFG